MINCYWNNNDWWITYVFSWNTIEVNSHPYTSWWILWINIFCRLKFLCTIDWAPRMWRSMILKEKRWRRAGKTKRWRFLEMGVSLNHPFLDGIFHYKPSILGYPHFWKHPTMKWKNVEKSDRSGWVGVFLGKWGHLWRICRDRSFGLRRTCASLLSAWVSSSSWGYPMTLDGFC